MSFDITWVGLNREGRCGNSDAFVTYNFTISEGRHQVHAEVMFTSNGRQVIEHEGKDAKVAARLALERVLVGGRNPFKNPVLLRLPHKHAEYFAKHGYFHHSLR